MHRELAAAAERQALHRGDHRHLRVFEDLRGALEFLDGLFEQIELPGRAGLADLLEVGADGERRGVPDHHAVERRLGLAHGGEDAVEHLVAQRMVLRDDRQDADAGVDFRQPPQAHAVVPVERLAGLLRRRLASTEYLFREQLAPIDRQIGARNVGAPAGRPGTLRRMHAGTAVRHPGRQRRAAHRHAGRDVGRDRLGDHLPAGSLPGLERPLRPAEAPAHREIDVAGVVGDALELHRAVMEHVAEDRPEEARLRMRRGAQRGELLGRRLDPEERGDLVGHRAGRRAVVLERRVEHEDVLALLAVDAAPGLLPQRAFPDQRRQPVGRFEMGMPGIVGQRVPHRLDDVRQRVEADDVGGAVGGALRPADLRAGQHIDLVETEAEGLRVVHHREDRKHPDTIRHKIRRIERADHALAEARGEPGLERVHHAGSGVARGDDLHQAHVARRVEEMDAAEARPHGRRQPLRQRVDRQARGVGGNDSRSGQMRGDLRVKIVLPVHALDDRLDHQVAAGQQRQMFLVVGRVDVLELALARQRRGAQFLQAIERLRHDAVLVAFRRRQVEQNDRHVGVRQMSGDLRPHHAGAEHGRLPHDQLVQAVLLWAMQQQGRAKKPRSRRSFFAACNQKLWLNWNARLSTLLFHSPLMTCRTVPAGNSTARAVFSLSKKMCV